MNSRRALGSWGLPRLGIPGAQGWVSDRGSGGALQGPGEPCGAALNWGWPCVSGPGPCDHRASSPYKPSCPSHPMKDRGSMHTQSQAPGGGWPSSGIQRKPGSSAPSQAPPSVRRACGEEGRPGLGLWWLERREGPLSTHVLPCRSTGTSRQRPSITGSVGTTRCRAPGRRPVGRCVPAAGTGRAPGPCC